MSLCPPLISLVEDKVSMGTPIEHTQVLGHVNLLSLFESEHVYMFKAYQV